MKGRSATDQKSKNIHDSEKMRDGDVRRGQVVTRYLHRLFIRYAALVKKKETEDD